MVVGTAESRMNEVIVEVFEKICDAAAENNNIGEGWKTNSHYKVNQKFIIPGCVAINFNGKPELHHYYYSRGFVLDELSKALCYIRGIDYSKMNRFDPSRLCGDGEIINGRRNNPVEFGTWYEFNFFTVKMFKKGTMHVVFSDEEVWAAFNRKYAQIKGWRVPSQTDRKKKGTERK